MCDYVTQWLQLIIESSIIGFLRYSDEDFNIYSVVTSYVKKPLISEETTSTIISTSKTLI
jgi:hypothetical protein